MNLENALKLMIILMILKWWTKMTIIEGTEVEEIETVAKIAHIVRVK